LRKGEHMTKSVMAIAALAAALSTAAFAADVKSTQPAPMTDRELDAVTGAHVGIQNRTIQVTTLGAPQSGWRQTVLSTTAQFGLTGDVPDFRLITSVPVGF